MRKAIAIDFDGCLCANVWPEIGAPNWPVIHAALEEQKRGTALILWTCRSGELLDKAVAWCGEHGLVFDAINENLPERLEHYQTESRKVSADEYWDDLAVRMPLPPCVPLTMDELLEMDGEPVWIAPVKGRGKIPERWMLVSDFFPKDKIYLFMPDSGIAQGYRATDYGKTWIAYRRRPEEMI